MRPSSGTILLVEDDFVLRASLAELFSSQGYLVECAAHGLEAFHRLNTASVKPSVIVLDLMMPYMDGLEFRTLQKALPSVADIPVVVITANGKSAVEAAQMDVKETFYKPVNTWRLLETVRALAQSARS
ncbi:MAG TPA: response regulator [Polyangia bacterium]|jgi:CheY-like chemotaxis protein